jgi:AhpD family alkylhydroperoxidase
VLPKGEKMDYQAISPEIVAACFNAYAAQQTSSLDKGLKALVELRVSQINGCNVCCATHSAECKNQAIDLEKIKLLSIWYLHPNLFNAKEWLALSWAEALTRHNHDSINQIKFYLKQAFSDKEIVDLSCCIAIMNAMNRIGISLGNHYHE